MKYQAELDQAIADYERTGRTKARRERAGWRAMSDRKAIELIGQGRMPDDSLNTHLGQVKNSALEELSKRLLKKEILTRLEKATSFKEIYEIIDREAWQVDGVNKSRRLSVTVYDAAFAVAAAGNRNFKPEGVYLHAYPGKGVRLLGIDTRRRKSVSLADLPEVLRRFPAWQVEDILCHFAKAVEDGTGQ